MSKSHPFRPALAALALVAVLAAVTPGRVLAAGDALAPPDDHRLALLIYQAIAALDQANATGNYTVLRDLAAPGFRDRNTAAELGLAFAKYRELRFALAPVLLYEPRLTHPVVVTDGLIRLRGYFPTRPVRVNFDLTFAHFDDDWRLHGLAIAPSEARAQGRAGP